MSAPTDASVVVLGSLHLDVMVEAPGRPRLGETMVGTAFALVPGGKGGNQAVAAASHGARVAMAGAVGDDQFGRTLLDHLRDHGVDARMVEIFAGAGSGMSVAIAEPSGDYGAIIVSGANLLLNADSVARSAGLIGAAKWLVLQNEIPEAANIAAAAVARAEGCRVILNAAPARPLSAALAALLDVIVVNALEAEALAGSPVVDLRTAAAAAAALRGQGPCAIVTAGGHGLALSGDGPTLTLAAHDVAVVSTHGAGDAFVGALAARLAGGAELVDAARYANAAAALVVATPHAARGTLGPEATMRLLRASTP